MNTLTIMVGLPGSGKSTIAKELNGVIISTDEIRKELTGTETSQERNNEVFDIAYKRIEENLKANNDVIFDATNINYKRRMDFINRFKKYHPLMQACFAYVPYEECLKRNKNRERQVPEEVIKRMYMNFYVPQWFEGFTKIYIKHNYNQVYTGVGELEKRLNISHDNPNHTLNVWEHCLKTYDFLFYKDYSVMMAGLLHDCGKPFCKTFINTKGEETEIAHFYGHEKVGAYDSLFYTEGNCVNDQLYIAQLIQWHMLLHDKNLTEKTINKYKEKFGEKFWNDSETLHRADLAAH